MPSFVSKSLNDLEKVITHLLPYIKKGNVIGLIGEIGVGKTTIAQHFAKHLGIKKNITSPTFTLVKEYDLADGKLVHIDAYRLEKPTHEDYQMIQEYFSKDNIVLIEWMNYLPKLINKNVVIIEILKEDNVRTIKVHHGK